MNFVLHGVAVSAGITIGRAHLVSSARLEAAHYEIAENAIQAEIFRFDAAISRARQELTAIEGQMPDNAPGEFDAFINLSLECNSIAALRSVIEYAFRVF